MTRNLRVFLRDMFLITLEAGCQKLCRKRYDGFVEDFSSVWGKPCRCRLSIRRCRFGIMGRWDIPNLYT